MNRQMLSARLLTRTQESVLRPLTAVVLTVASCVRRLQRLPWAPILALSVNQVNSSLKEYPHLD